MSSPFPGMDPYLESRAIWSDLHQSLITYSRDALQPRIRPRYHAHIGERVYIIHPPRVMYPDVAITERRPTLVPAGPAGVAVLEPDAPMIISLPPEEVRETFIEILDLTQGGRVVTVIEVLSPANKTSGEGRELYLRKQEDVLSSETHLVEIDLLRQGEHTVAIPPYYLIPYQPWHYLISISRATRRDRCEVYPRTVRQRLPRIMVPLLAPDPDTVLDLQAMLDRCYENGAYADVIDYGAQPEAPLAPDDAAWADDLLRRKGLRAADPQGFQNPEGLGKIGI